MTPNQNAPTVATLIVGFVSALLAWGADAVDAPPEVESAGIALVIAVVAIVAGRLTQRYFTDPKG